VGRDVQYASYKDAKLQVSIHAPAWGATQAFGNLLYYYYSFNPRARVGRDPTKSRVDDVDSEFQSTRPRGARLLQFGWADWRKTFQSTRPRGARLPNIIAAAKLSAVSIHAPAWGAT